MDTKFIGLRIRRERLLRNWSQEGLASGICAVSYLSKIEQGKADAGEDIICALLARLGLSYCETPDLSALVERTYSAIFSCDYNELETCSELLKNSSPVPENGRYMADALVFNAYMSCNIDPFLSDCEDFLNLRQKTVLYVALRRYAEAISINPCAFTHISAGNLEYYAGEYTKALAHLQRAYDLACNDGSVYVMLHSRILMGNCYSNLMELDDMLAEYNIAKRIAKALCDADCLRSIDYNIAATNLELGNTRAAYDCLSNLESPNLLALHKLAIAAERLGMRKEALSALEKAEKASETLCDSQPDNDTLHKMCALVRYRLEHDDYLRKAEYGAALLSLFEYMKKNLPQGYAGFHMPWVLEWYKATRQYKQAFSLLSEFPAYGKILRDFPAEQ